MDEFKKRIIEEILSTIQNDGYSAYTICCVYYSIVLHMRQCKEEDNQESYILLYSYALRIVDLIEEIANVDMRKMIIQVNVKCDKKKLLPENLLHWKDNIESCHLPILKNVEDYFYNEI